MGFIGGNANPFLYVKKSEKGLTYIASYVDSSLMMGDDKAIADAMTALKENGLVLKIVGGLQDFLSCKVKFSVNKNRAWLGQPHLIEIIEKKFGYQIKNIQSH